MFFSRILNHPFAALRKEDGPVMWKDFFTVLRQMDLPLHRAKKIERLGIYADAFSFPFGRNRLGLDFSSPWV